MIEEILPAAVAAEEAFDDPPDVVLFPEEEALLARAVDKRRREFATARVCARRAFARLGVDPAPILPGRRGAPQWPPGLVGSMTHCAGYRAAALAPDDRIVGLGIDAEPDEAVPDGVFDLISRPDERAHLAELTDAVPGLSGDRLLFSAKESVFKAWFPLTGRELGFKEATLRFDPDDRTFRARVLADPPRAVEASGTETGHRDVDLSELRGRWVARDGLLITSVVVS